MVAFAHRRSAAKSPSARPEGPLHSSHTLVELTAKSSHAYLGLLALEMLISELRQEFPWRADLSEAAELIVEIAEDLDLRPIKKS